MRGTTSALQARSIAWLRCYLFPRTKIVKVTHYVSTCGAFDWIHMNQLRQPVFQNWRLILNGGIDTFVTTTLQH